MKNLNLFSLILLAAIIFLGCSKENNETEFNSQLSIEEYGKIHNEVVIELINMNSNNQHNEEELLSSMTLSMTKKYPTLFDDKDLENMTKFFFNSTIKYYSRNEQFNFGEFYEQIRQEATENDVSEEIIHFYDDMYNQFSNNESKSIKKSISEYRNKLINQNEIKSLEIFYSIYNSSKELWTETAPKKYLLDYQTNSRSCDPDQQVILADAIAGGLFSLFSGPGGVLVGGAASYLVREQQIQNAYGGCI